MRGMNSNSKASTGIMNNHIEYLPQIFTSAKQTENYHSDDSMETRLQQLIHQPLRNIGN